MGRKTRKYFFGVFEDGPVLKIAQLISSNDHPILIDIKKTEMESSIYHDIEREQEPDIDNIEEPEPEFNDITELNFDDSSELDSVVNPHEHLLSIFPLNQGKICLNANDEKITSHYLDRSVKSLGRKDLVKLQLLSYDDLRDKDVTWGVIQTAQDQTNVIIHKGENKLLSYLQKYNQIQSERKYYYSLVDCNDVSILNAVRLNYEINKEDDILVLYLGFDYKKGILMKGEEFIKSLPILTSSDDIDLQREITSKLTLYQDEMEIPHVEKIIIAGEYCQDDMIMAIADAFPSAEVERFRFSELLFSENLTEDLPEEELASFVIPISLAWKEMAGKKEELYRTNFLEKKIIKSQKVIQFSWHSFAMLAILLGLSFTYTSSLLNMQNQVQISENNYYNKKMEYQNIQQQYDPGPDIQNEISRIKNEIEYVRGFYNDKAIWSDIVEKLNIAVKEYPITWLSNIQGNDQGFSISGVTTKRKNILILSELFPNGLINSVQARNYDDKVLWSFDVTYSYPEALPIVRSWYKEPPAPRKKIEKTKIEKKLPVKPVKRDSVDDEEKIVEQTVERKTENPIYADYREIIEDYYSFRRDEMLEKAKRFIEKYPKNSLATNCRYLMGEIYLHSNDLVNAEKLLDTVLEVDSPMEPYALFKLAEIYQKTDRLYLAIVNLNLVKSRFPDSDVITKTNKMLEKLEANHE